MARIGSEHRSKVFPLHFSHQVKESAHGGFTDPNLHNKSCHWPVRTLGGVTLTPDTVRTSPPVAAAGRLGVVVQQHPQGRGWDTTGLQWVPLTINVFNTLSAGFWPCCIQRSTKVRGMSSLVASSLQSFPGGTEKVVCSGQR